MSKSMLSTNYNAVYNAFPAPITRDELIESHLPQIKFIAERIAVRLPVTVDCNDLIGAGVLGLLDAADKFDPSRGVLFKTYAELRVRGAILDSLRDLDWVPRSVRKRARTVEATYRRIETEQGRAANEEEVADAMGLPLTEFHALLSEMRWLTVTNIDQEDDRENGHSTRQIPADPELIPSSIFERAEIRGQLSAAIDELPTRERQVVALYYLEELTMKEIGAVLNITESRVSQIHTQAIIHLRAALNFQ